MAAKRKSAPAKSKAPVSTHRRWPRSVGVSVLLVGLLVGSAWSLELARQTLRQAAFAENLPMKVSPAPGWLRVDPAQKALAPFVGTAEMASVRSLGEQLERSPWIKQAQVMRKRGRVEAIIHYRQPVQAIAWGQHCVYTDSDGVALDLSEMTHEAGADCVTVEGIDPLGTPRHGGVLGDGRAATTGNLVAEMGALRYRVGLDKIVLPTTSEQPAELRCGNGARIVWGDIETDISAKIERLQRQVPALGLLPATAVVDLRSSKELVLKAPTVGNSLQD